MGRYIYPESAVFYRKLDKVYPKIVRGEGCWLYDDQGNKYLDAVGGAYVANLGHGVPEIADAIAAQARKIGYVNGTAFTHEAVEELAERVAELSPGDLKKVYFLSSGSEAVEAALKLARQYWVELGRPKKKKIIARSPGYHGNTLLALSASARGHYKKTFEPWLAPVRMIPAPYAYRCPCKGLDAACAACTAQVLEEAIRAEDPYTVAAFIAEPVGGSSTGASVPRPEYYKKVREICDKYHVLFIADEVLTGAGRTGTWSSIEPYGAVPDLMTLGKGISGGYVPLSAVVAPQRIVDVLAKGQGALLHAQTMSHHPVACAAGVATLKLLKERKLIERCARMGEILHQRLGELLSLPGVGDVRGRGLLAGIELVADKETRAAFPRKLKVAEAVTEKAQKLGLVLWPNVGQADGENGDLLMVAPPFTISEAEIGELVSRLKAAIEQSVPQEAKP